MWESEKIAFLVIGWETCPQTGTPHFQGYLELVTKTRFLSVRPLSPRAHWEPRRGTPKEAADYCKKGWIWRQKGQPASERKSALAEARWAMLRDMIQAHDTWSTVVQDPALAGTVASKMQWARCVFEEARGIELINQET